MAENIAGTYQLHAEKGAEEQEKATAVHAEFVHRTKTGTLYKTRHGIELIPTPSDDPNDPLNWPLAWKLLVLFCVCCSSLMVAFCAAGIIPGFADIAVAYDTSINRVSYLVSVNVLWLALGPMVWSVVCDTYGRRPVYLISMFITFIASIGCAVAKSYGVQVFTRMLQGFGASGPFSVGAGSIADVFFLHERGMYNGLWIVSSQAGPFVAPMITGAVIQNTNWRWSLWLMAILAGSFFILMFFCLPETLYVRNLESGGSSMKLSNEGGSPRRKRLFAQTSFGRIAPKSLSFLGFFRPLYMLKYPSIGLLALSWCISVAMPDIGISNIVPLAFGEVYGWGPRAQGLSNAGFLVGCLIGEVFTGKVSDWYISRRTKNNGGVFIPEMRLTPMIPGLIMMPFGLAGFGICVEHKTHWIGPVSMMAVTMFGYQQLSSLGMAYGIDCYKPQAPYVAAGIAFCRQLFGFTVNYWLLPWVEHSGFQTSYISQGAVVAVFGSGPIVLLMIWGRKWRESRPVPQNFGTSQ